MINQPLRCKIKASYKTHLRGSSSKGLYSYRVTLQLQMYKKNTIFIKHTYIVRTCNSYTEIHLTMRCSTVYKLLFVLTANSTTKEATKRNPTRLNVNQTYTHNMEQAQIPFFGASSTFFSARQKHKFQQALL